MCFRLDLKIRRDKGQHIKRHIDFIYREDTPEKDEQKEGRGQRSNPRSSSAHNSRSPGPDSSHRTNSAMVSHIWVMFSSIMSS